MSSSIWTPAAVASEARPWRANVWRMVEAQHIASTMKIVDTRDEQDLLEDLLERSKPAAPTETGQLDYLLATPFRYRPLKEGSRFRATTDPGVFYGAASVHTAGAELGYWRWRFLRDAADLERLGPVAHTAFCAAVHTSAVDLRQPPFKVDAKHWKHHSDYGSTQAFGRIARAAAIRGIVYESVRDPQRGECVALLAPDAFSSPRPLPEQQTWFLAVTKTGVTWRRDNDSLAFAAADWEYRE